MCWCVHAIAKSWSKTLICCPIFPSTNQLAWTYHYLKQQWAYVTQTINEMKQRLGMNCILREEKHQWWENIGCITMCKKICLKIFTRKGMGGCHIIFRFSGYSSWCNIGKKSWCVYLSFVNKYVLQNNCLCDDWHCNNFNSVNIVIIVVLIIHANKKHSGWYFIFLMLTSMSCKYFFK